MSKKLKLILGISGIVGICLIVWIVFQVGNNVCFSNPDVINVGSYKIKLVTQEEDDDYKISLYDKLEDSNIYLHNLEDVLISYKDEEKYLKDWLEEDETFLNKLTDNLEVSEKYRDGGSILYKNDKCDNVYILKCDTKDGNKDIHIGKSIKYEGEVCNISDVVFNISGIMQEDVIRVNGKKADLVKEIIAKYEGTAKDDNCDCFYMDTLKIGDKVYYTNYSTETDLHFSYYNAENKLLRFEIPNEDAQKIKDIMSL